MDLSFLDRTSHVTPLLVRVYDEHKLYRLAKGQLPGGRIELANAITELLEASVTPRESELIADIMIELLRQAETDLRQALSEKISAMPTVPLRLVLQFANDDISVADPMLRNSPVLGDLDLIYIIKSQGAFYWRSIAKRHALSTHVVDVLSDTRDLDTAIALAENSSIHLSEHAALALSDIAQESDKLAKPLLRRDDVTDEIAASLYRYVGEDLKRYITQNYGIDSNILTGAVEEVIEEFTGIIEDAEFMPTEAMMSAADRFRDKGLLTVKLMLGTLRRGQFGAFVAQFSRFTGLEPKIVMEILSQKAGQGLAVACRAHGITKADFVSFFLLTNRIRTRGKMVDMQDMTRAVNYFNRITDDVARNIMTNSIKEITKES